MPLSNSISGSFILFLLSVALGWAEDRPIYDNGLLTIPSVDSPGGVGTYQDAVFEYTDQAGWMLRSALTLGGAGLSPARVTEVEIVRIDAFPAQILLRASGPDSIRCGGEYRFASRREGDHFLVQLSQTYITSGGTCTADVRPFKKSIALPVYGVPAGAYTYDLNGFTGSFELAADNELSGDCDYCLIHPPGFN